jgi:urease accessory protein
VTAGAPALIAREILGDAGDARFAGRRVERLVVESAHATRRRLRGRTDGGTDVAVDLPPGAFLAHGAVLADDGERVIAVQRPAEEVAVVRLRPDVADGERLSLAVRLGHVLGNMHTPLELAGEEIRIPVTTSRRVLADAIEPLGALELSFEQLPLACAAPLAGPAGGHRH